MKWNVGDIVLANWTHDEYWYPAVVKNIDGERIYVHFMDGDKEWTSEENLLVMDIEAGDRVHCRWQGGSYYYPGRIVEKNGDKIFIHYDDSDEEWSTIGLVRVTR